MNYIDKIASVLSEDDKQIRAKDKEYGGSWKKRGGVGAFMMLCRKWDRLEKQVEAHGWDVFAAARVDSRQEGLLDDIRDLRRYLTLVEAEVLCQKLRFITSSLSEANKELLRQNATPAVQTEK